MATQHRIGGADASGWADALTEASDLVSAVLVDGDLDHVSRDRLSRLLRWINTMAALAQRGS